ncbi:MAG TPA: peptidylprolyl isomerase [Roseiflexaceae bacterium]|nr:peptidylprolyl isomerase [Roseiflexaceae bacterium]
MAQTPKKPTTTPPARPITKRGLTRLQRERRRQRMVLIATASAIGVALLAIIVGVLYDRVWVPSRPVAEVGSNTLSRSGYWTERRNEITRQMTQNLQLLRLFGDQSAQQFAGQITQLETLVPSIRSAPVDDATVNQWIDRQVIVQGASSEGIQASDGEVAQTLVNDLNRVFPPPPPMVTDTNQLSSTNSLSNTTATTVTAKASITSAPTAAGTSAATGATSNPTAANGPTATPEPTFTPQPTLTADAALAQRDALIDRVYSAYRSQVASATGQNQTNLTMDDFQQGLHDQYLRQTLTNKVEEKLVPESSFKASEEPTSYTVRQILVKADVPQNASEAERNAIFEQIKPRADGILQQLQKGESFEQVARQATVGTSAVISDTLPAFDPSGKTTDGTQIDPAIVDAAKKLQVNETSGLIQTPFGWHIIQLANRQVDSKDTQLNAARTKAFDTWVAEQRAKLNIQQYPPQTPTATTAPTAESGSPLPTANLIPSTASLTNTNSLTGTGTLTGTATLPSTAQTAVPEGTAAPTTSAGQTPEAATAGAGTTMPTTSAEGTVAPITSAAQTPDAATPVAGTAATTPTP